MKVLGNEVLLSQIDEALRSRRLFHACIISGSTGIGKKTLAKYVATAAVCTDEGKPCGRCSGCLKSEKDVHPDIDYVRPDGTEIKVNQIRALRSSLYTLPNEAPCRVAVIENADSMNVNAQNAMLNILEEPPSSVLIILICENESELLLTIRSRCVHFRMQPIPESTIKDELLKRNLDLTEEEAEAASRKSDGILGRALEFIETENEDGFTRQIIEALSNRNIIKLINLAPSLEKGVNRDALSEIIKSVQKIMGNAAAHQSGKTNFYYSEEEQRISYKYNRKELFRMCQICAKLIRYCESNVGVGHIVGAFVSLLSEEIDR